MTPNNADFSTGDFTWKAKDPSLPADQYNPSVTSTVYGENYFERNTQTLWVLIKGAEPIEIRTTAVIMVTFGVPAVSIDDFYEENLVRNLAALLNVDSSQIRIVEIVSEASRRRRRAVEGEVDVNVEIGPQPVATIESPGSENTLNETDTTTEAPVNIPSEYWPHSWRSHLMSYSLNTRGCVPVHAHYSNLPNCICFRGQPRFQNVIEF